METSTVQQQEQLFQKFESYSFDADANFQAGMKSIIGNAQNKSAQEQKDAVEKAKYFYYSRFVQSFDYNQYQAWRQLKAATSIDQDESQGSSAPSSTPAAPIVDETIAEESQSSSTAADPTYPKSFQEICELIASGKPIPGIRQIPNNLAEGTPSEAKLAPKLKPWEKKKAGSAEESVVESITSSADATA
ncbi:hypothetical protein EC957_001646 [Mortierella hygrophila]|uniref:Uncharacterized protein n=1 Tax=Mortierella hygrophila TaxID=979708 RepID=A0A9P6FGR8_9FUNG|nr:hypothetical protein EC957_001646 [Mortierella hygrophila]